MSCCSPITSPKGVAAVVSRVGFGLALLLIGIAHYQEPSAFAEMVGRGLGALEPIGMVWGYILPALMIIGGALIALGLYMNIGAWLAGVALFSIPAGLMLKSVLSGVSLGDTMPGAINALIWSLVYLSVVRSNACCTWPMNACDCGSSCDCGPAAKPAHTHMKAPVLIAKGPVKKSSKKK